MPVNSFSIADIIPNLVNGLITYVPDVYNENHGLSGMAAERPPQIEPKIRIMGKIYTRPVAGDIPESSEATLIKDTKFSDEMFTAPEYGKGFSVTTNDLIQNQDYMVNFKSMTIQKSQAPQLVERVRNASNLCIEMIKRAADTQVKQLMDTATLQFDNYQTVDYGRDTNNSAVISTANLKWTIDNKATMKPYSDIEAATEQVADRGNSGDAEFFAIMGRGAYKAYVNCDDYKDDSNQRRNYKVERLSSVDRGNVNIPKGAVYRESILKNAVGITHIFTYNQTFTNSAGNATQWIDTDKVYILASDNIYQRQPVEILTMNDLVARSTKMAQLLRATPSMKGWLITPEWNKCTNRALVMGIYRKFLTQALTPNKTFTLTANS
ncbi:MAG: major capsid protein [Aureibaculum sp.]|nr:major capsid protein [Aureibaculum sp.]